jgi:ectoine hydroxylase
MRDQEATVMWLTEEQLEGYDRTGFLLLEDHFSSEELDLLMSQIPGEFGERSSRRILEKNGAVRTVFASHTTNEVFDCFSRLPKLVEPAMMILGSEVYIHQFKINAKVALYGDQWEWHQDFLYWHKEDSMPAPRVLTAVLFLQEVNDYNGPILVIPGSHKEGMIETIQVEGELDHIGPWQSEFERPPSWRSTLTADLKYKVDKTVLARLINQRNIHAIKGSAGSVLFFHGNLFHASANNLSPWDRICVFVTYNSVENLLGYNENPRPDFIACRDFRPIDIVSETALTEMASQELQESLA